MFWEEAEPTHPLMLKSSLKCSPCLDSAQGRNAGARGSPLGLPQPRLLMVLFLGGLWNYGGDPSMGGLVSHLASHELTILCLGH